MPGLVQPQRYPAPGPAAELELTEEEQEPITTFTLVLNALLRSPRRVVAHLGQPGGARLAAWLAAIALVCLAVYGVVVGTFSGHEQLWAAPLKITGGLFISGIICLPSLYIFACLSGANAKVGQIAGLLTGLMALVGVLLVGFGPVGWLFGQSTDSVAWMGFLHLLFWGVGLGFGVRFLHTGFRRMQSRNPGVFFIWVGIFLLVVLQMSTALRPILGRAPTLLPVEKRFFLAHWSDCLRGKDNPPRPAE